MNRWLLSVSAIAPVALTVYAVNKPKVTSTAVPEAQEATYARLLEQAQDTARQNQLGHAIAQIEKIPENSRYRTTAQQLVSAWTQDLIGQATEAYRQGDVAKALSLFPAGTSPNPQVQQLRKAWSQEAARLEQIQASANRGNWQQVLKSIESIKDTGLYANPRIQALLQSAINASRNAEIAAAPKSTPVASVERSASVEAASSTVNAAVSVPKQPAVDVAQAMKMSEPRRVANRRLLIAMAQQPRVKTAPRPKAAPIEPVAQEPQSTDQTVDLALHSLADRCAAQTVLTPQMVSMMPNSAQKLQVKDSSSNLIAMAPPRLKSGAKAALLPEEDSRRLESCLVGTSPEQSEVPNSSNSLADQSSEIQASMVDRPSTNSLEIKKASAW